MASPLLGLLAELRAVLADFVPGRFAAGDCARLAEELAATEKACAGARLLAAARAIEAGAVRGPSDPDGSAWLARQAGTTAHAARQALATARSLGQCADTQEALLAGRISLAQAQEITQAEADTPGAERDLLAVAAGTDLSRLRDQARQHRQAHSDAGDLRRHQLQARHFRHWRDRLGLVCFAGALPPETGLPLIRRVEAAALRARRQARAGGQQPDRFEALAADALAALTARPDHPNHPGSAAGASAELVVVCDLYAWRRGHTHPGEVCHLLGGGPIPVEVAHQHAGDAFVKAVLHDGTNIHTVKHFGRHLPAAMRTALDLGPVPHFSGRECADCGRQWGLEYDHVNPLANHGPTQYANLQARCWPHHQAKTERDRQAGLLGPHPPPTPTTPRPPPHPRS